MVDDELAGRHLGVARRGGDAIALMYERRHEHRRRADNRPHPVMHRDTLTQKPASDAKNTRRLRRRGRKRIDRMGRVV
jgi:hypothetical protein